MEIVHGSRIPFTDPAAAHRSGGIAFKILSAGTEGSVNNYVLELARQTGFYSPRHRHNFDQFRVAIKGNFSLAPDVVLEEGSLSYHPEGVYYGPQDDGPDEQILLLLQFGGASGQGFLSLDQLRRANNELLKTGRFEGGKYYPGEDDNKGSRLEPIDGFEAAWTFANGDTKLMYPSPRYMAPIVMHPENFSWRENHRHGSIAYEKTLGMFSERRAIVKMYMVKPGGQLVVTDEHGEPANQLLYVLDGKGKVEKEMIATESVIRVPPYMKRLVVIVAGQQTLHLLHFSIPQL